MQDYMVIDGKRLAGPSLDRALRRVKALTATKKGEFHGFSTARGLAEWAESHGVGSEHAEAARRLRRARGKARAMSEADKTATKRHLVRRAEHHRAELEDLFAARGVDPHDINQLNALAEHDDPLLGRLLGCAILFDEPGYRGGWQYLTPVYHPDLSWYGWGNRAASAWVPPALFGTPAALYDEVWFGAGLTFSMWYPVPDLGVFTKRAESAWTW